MDPQARVTPASSQGVGPLPPPPPQYGTTELTDNRPIASATIVEIPTMAAPAGYSNMDPPVYSGMERMNQGMESSVDAAVRRAQEEGVDTQKWTSGIFDCFKDGESCWWSFWCPLLIFARTSRRFELTSSSCGLLLQLALLILVGMLLGALLGGLAGVLIALCLAIWRCVYRTRLRTRMGIQGGQFEDFGLHLCCGPCVLAQEARQAKDLGLPPIEFCTGELLAPGNDSVVTATTAGELPGFWSELMRVSKCSKLIMVGSALLLIVAGVASMREPWTVGVLLLALVEPAIIMWLVYWRRHRKEASLDTVIKLFAVGFFWTSQFAGMTEPVIEFAFMGIASAIGITPSVDPNADDAQTEQAMKGWAKQNFAVVVLGLFLTAYVVAAGVEELYKYFIVRFCTLGGPLRNPHAILTYLVAGAAGFSCAENIMYAMGFNQGMKGVSVLAGELYVMGLRALMPIHVICAGLQAINYIKHTVEETPMSLFRMLLPALLLHGTFDFILMLLAGLQFAYDLNDTALNIASLVIGIVIAIVSLCVTMKLWKQQQERVGLGWQRVDDDIEVQIPVGQDRDDLRPSTGALLTDSSMPASV